jgi:hypothetical protein
MYKYFYDTTSEDMKEEDWTAVSIKAIIVRKGVYRLYRCRPFDGDEQDAPQGERVNRKQEEAVAQALFPSTLYGMKPDQF